MRDVHKRFGYREVLGGVSFTLAHGALALTGANGSGKSTLLAIVAGLTRATSGEVSLGDLAIRERHARSYLGYVPESLVPFASLTAGEFLALMAELKRVTMPEHASLAHVLGKEMSALSLGERRRVCLAAAMTGTPRLLVLDEPSNGLDTLARQAIVHTLDAHLEAGGTVLMATHDLAFARELGCTRLHLDAGKIAPLAIA